MLTFLAGAVILTLHKYHFLNNNKNSFLLYFHQWLGILILTRPMWKIGTSCNFIKLGSTLMKVLLTKLETNSSKASERFLIRALTSIKLGKPIVSWLLLRRVSLLLCFWV